MSSWTWLSNAFYNGELFFYLIPFLLVVVTVVLFFAPEDEEQEQKQKNDKLPINEAESDDSPNSAEAVELDLSEQKTDAPVVSLAEEMWQSARPEEDAGTVETPRPSPVAEQEQKHAPKMEKEPRSLEEGLKKTKSGFMARLKQLFSASAVDDALIEELEEILYTADIGTKTVSWLLSGVEQQRGNFSSGDDVKTFLKSEIEHILQSVEKPLEPPVGEPGVCLMVGVNGAGKTTTIGKLASLFSEQYGKRVVLAAGDTFRAAAVEQLEEWGKRADCEVIKGKEGADPASVAYNAIEGAKARKADVVIVDTAGRLQNRVNLMEELKKVRRVIGKAHEGAPHEVLLVVDANNGQNAVRQAADFHKEIGLTGIIVTKLDGTAKGGVLIGIARELGIPVRMIGIGEHIADLRAFNARDFTEALFS